TQGWRALVVLRKPLQCGNAVLVGHEEPPEGKGDRREELVGDESVIDGLPLCQGSHAHRGVGTVLAARYCPNLTFDHGVLAGDSEQDIAIDGVVVPRVSDDPRVVRLDFSEEPTSKRCSQIS